MIVSFSIPSRWLGNARRAEALRTILGQKITGVDPLDCIQRWKKGGLKTQFRRALADSQKTGLEIVVADADYRRLAGAAAGILRAPEDLLTAMAGEIEETLATWEKVEAASAGDAICHHQAKGEGKATVAQLHSDPILPGDKVVFIHNKRSRADDARFTNRAWWGHWTRENGKPVRKQSIHSVRKTSVHPITGEQVIHLVGCFGVSLAGEGESGFSASDFRKVSESCGVGSLGDEDVIQIPIDVTARIARQLESFALFPEVEAIHGWENEEKLEVVCRRWVNRWHQSKTIRDASALVRQEIARDSSVTILVPMSALGWQNLDGVCKRLEIPPAAWLQGVLYNLAVRAQKMRDGHEMALRNAHRRKD